MESIKNKMESLVKDKEEMSDTADKLEAEKVDFQNKASGFDKSVSETERKISQIEEEFDDVTTKHHNALEKLEIATKESSDFELEVSALVRRVQLLEEETARVQERLDEVCSKLTTVEKSAEDNERQRKILEANSFSNEEKMELQEVQLTEAKTIAEDADRKYEEVVRKCRMVEQELERVVDKAEEFEGKSHEFETRLDADRQKLKELEELASKNGEQEDIFEEQVRKLAANLSNEESRAEFAERTVDKLESTIDYLQDNLYNEKLAFIEMSKKLDQTLNDMMQV